MDELILPPLLNAVYAKEPLQSAIEKTRRRKAGAGDLFWSDKKNIANIAIVLEPEVKLKNALEMMPLAMVALSDCLAVMLPPKVAVQFRDCNNVVLNGGVVAGITMAVSKMASKTEVPDWLVLAIEVGLSREDDEAEPGLQPDITTLDEEGCEDYSRNKFIETYARHFLSWLAIWSDDGFGPVARAWKFKAEDQKEPDMEQIGEIISIHKSAA